MRRDFLTVPALVLFAMPALLVAQDPRPVPRSMVSLCVTTAIGTCGEPCEMFKCTPHYTLVSGGETMTFEVGGAEGAPFVLFGGMAVPGCMSIPGIAGQLAAWAPTVLQIGYCKEPGIDVCGNARTVIAYPVPPVPPGVDIRFQVLGMNTYMVPGLTFSRPTEVRTR
jgi:hypothetical protein